MHKEEALELMKSSANIHQWNDNRQTVLDSLEKEGEQYTHLIKMPQRAGHEKHDEMVSYNFRTCIPKWFFNEINSGLISKVLIN